MGQSTAAARNPPSGAELSCCQGENRTDLQSIQTICCSRLRVMKPVFMRYHGPVIEQFRSISPLFVRDHRSGDFAFSILIFAISLALFASLGSQITWIEGKPLPAPAGLLACDCSGSMLLFSSLNVISGLRLRGKKGSMERSDGLASQP